MKILHLSDLHFVESNDTQDIVIETLLKKIEKDLTGKNKPEIFIITGDIAFSGKSKEYEKAKVFIEKILNACDIKKENLFLIPGNHDVDRSHIKKEHIKWWYDFTDEDSLNQNLSSEDSFPKIIKKNEAYFEFARDCMSTNIEVGKFGEYVYTIQNSKSEKSEAVLKIVGLNSSLFCGYDGDDKEKLAIGLKQVANCESKVDSSKEVVISCIHHPINCFHPCEKASLNTLKRFSDIILSGHVHEASNSARTEGNSGDTIFVSAGSSYETRKHQNGFNVIDLNLETLSGNIIFYKYLPDEHTWILDKNINHETDGVFNFALKNKNLSKVTSSSESIDKDKKSNKDSSGQYMFVLDGTIDEFNRRKLEVLLSHIKSYTNDVSVTIQKIEEGSIKIYLETSKDIPSDIKDHLKQIDDLPIIEIKKIDNPAEVIKTDKSVFHWKTFLRPEFLETIGNPGASFTHSRVDNLSLKDLYVSPNLKRIKIDQTSKGKVEIINSDEVLKKKHDIPLKAVIYGSDYCGKSTLCKWCYDKFYEDGYIPILISGNSIKEVRIEKIKKIVNGEFQKQYNGILDGSLENYENDRIVLIIDDFHRIRFSNSKYKANLITNISKEYQNILLTGNDVMQFETYTSKSGFTKNIIEDFDKYQIVEFGPKLRYELIKKWNGLGIEQLEPNELIRLNNETESHVESIIGKNFVPSYPVYLLTILQAREATSSIKPEYSLHGFYYELLINEALNKAVKNKADISLFYNFITDYSYFLFLEKIRQSPLQIDDFIKFYNQYCQEYNINVNHKYILETLVNSKLLRVYDNTVSISYKYVYYFFVAKYLANNISNPKIKDVIKSLCERVHRDEFASIVMFLTHLSKDQYIINELLDNSKKLFKEIKPVQLNEDVSFINDMVKKLPEQVYKPVDIEEAKLEELKEEEELSIQEKEFDSEKHVYEYDINEDISSLDIISQITKAIKTIEITGQVTKKYWGELKGPQKYELAEETYMLGLRTLGFYYSLIEKDTEALVDYVKYIYRRKRLNKSFSKEEIDKASRNFIFGLCVMSSYGVIKNVTNSIGYEKLSGTFSDILKNHDYMSVKLIDTSIKLDHNKHFPWDTIKRLKPETDNHFLSGVVLKNLVINYLYVFHTSVEEKQKICNLLDIKMDQQREIDATSVVKKESSK